MKKFLILSLSLILITASCMKEKTPNRDHIPHIKSQLYKLQQAVMMKDRASIDSLLSVKMLDINQNSDSLLNFVYNAPGIYEAFEFEQFGNAEIIYTHNKAIINCYVMDSTHSNSRPIKFTLLLDDDIWLFKRFEPLAPETMDSTISK